MHFRVVIPARYASSRLPGKPLADIGGRPMVLHVLDRALQAGAESVVVATDDVRVQQAVKAAGHQALMTSPDHQSGTERLVEVAERAGARRSLLVQRAGDIDWGEVGDIAVLGLSAGASAPEIIVDEIIAAFGERFDVTVELAETAIETEDFPVMRALRDVELTASDMAFVNGA